MKTENVRWEISQILKAKAEVEKTGRSFDYVETQRLKTLREFLDSQHDENAVVVEKKEQPISESPF